MKKNIFFMLLLILMPIVICAQGFNLEKTALSNFLVRMYKQAPFDVKVVSDYEKNYLISAVVLDPTKYGTDENKMMRVASVKAMSQANRYFNGSNISTDVIMYIDESSEASPKMIEKIRERSVGYTNSLEFLTTFNNESAKTVFLYMKELKDN